MAHIHIFEINRPSNTLYLGTTGTTIKIASHTASRLLSLDASKDLESVTDLTAWIAGTANQVTVTDDTDGTLTLSLPFPDILTDKWLNSNFNTFLGMDVGVVGNLAHSAGVEGWYNTFIGFQSGANITTGSVNTGVGSGSLVNITEGIKNTGVGDNVLLGLTTGNYHTAVGQDSGKSVNTVDGCVFLGYSAGRYETAANKLFIDNAPRTNEADGRVKALVYGVFDAAVVNQSLTINAQTEVHGLVIQAIAKTGAYTLTAIDDFVECDASGGAFTITLPAVASTTTGKVYHIKKIDNSANVVIVDGNASETIDGGTTASITTQYECITIINNGSEWWIL